MRCRGLAYFDAARPLEQPTLPDSTPVAAVNVAAGALCQQRILMNSIQSELIALDAATGQFCPDFGTNGRVDLKPGLGKGPEAGLYSLTSAPTLAGTTVVVGGRVADNVSTDMPGGVVRGYDAVTGAMRWAFDPGNPDVKTAPAAGQTYARSPPNVWAPMSYDAASNTVFMPVGSAAIDIWGATPFDQLLCRIKFKSMRYDGLFTAPGTDPSLNLPGSLGGMNWGGLSVDPTAGYIFVNDMRVGLEVQLIPTAATGGVTKNDGSEGPNIKGVALIGTPYAINAKVCFMSPLEIPCQKPPFGTLTAVDMKTRQIAWQVPVGTVKDTGPFGIKMGLPVPIGMPTIGGTLATQGGLVFIAASQDYYLRAYDSRTGKEVWKGRLPVGSQGTPISYTAGGKHFVVVSAGGSRNSPDCGDYVMAYALPK